MSRANALLTVDAAVIVGNEVLLVQRRNDPFRGKWAIPGGFVEPDERLQEAAARELQEETGVQGVLLRQFHAYGEPGRDPRGRTVSFVFWTVMNDKPAASANDDAADCGWFALDALPPMSFDHEQILLDLFRHIRDLEKEISEDASQAN